MLVSSGNTEVEEAPEPRTRPRAPKMVVEAEDVDRARMELLNGYEALSRNATTLKWEMTALKNLLQLKWKGKGKGKVQDFEKKMTAVGNLAEGKVSKVKSMESSGAPASARTVARAME